MDVLQKLAVMCMLLVIGADNAFTALTLLALAGVLYGLSALIKRLRWAIATNKRNQHNTI